jgi:F-type H+-transporting ATPase subunit O
MDGIRGMSKTLKMNDLSKNLLESLAENNRTTFISAVVGSFNSLMAAHRGEVVCVVTTAKDLDAANKKASSQQHGGGGEVL